MGSGLIVGNLQQQPHFLMRVLISLMDLRIFTIAVSYTAQ
jgi:hypothetical protein